MSAESETDKDLETPRISEPPSSFKEFLKYLGPAFIFTSSAIGGGEILSVPMGGAYLGMVGLFLVPLTAFTRAFGQYYLVQYGVMRGRTFLDTCWQRKWMRWLFFYVLLGGIFYAVGLSAHLGETAGALNHLLPLSQNFWIVATLGFGFFIVFARSYNLVEKLSTTLLWIFLIFTVIVAALLWPSLEQWIIGFTPQLPGPISGLGTTSGIMTVAVIFTWVGAGFGPTVSYVWFAKDKKMGMFEAYDKGYELEPEDLTEKERKYLKGWRNVILYQNLISAAILTVFSVFIWIAASQTLYVRGKTPSGFEVLPQMVGIFTSVYGPWSANLFLICAITVLFSSIIGPLYGISRLWEDGFGRLGGFEKFEVKKSTVFRIFLVMLAIIPLTLDLIIGRPMWLFSLSSILFAPIIGLLYIAAIFFSYFELKEHTPELAPTRFWAVIIAIVAGIALILLGFLGFT